MIWALLGDYIFELLTSPTTINRKSAIVWAEHERIQGKPLLEYVGSELDEISIDVKFHDKLTNTDLQIRKLRELMLTREPQALVLGDGDYKGPYVIVDISDSPTRTTGGGRQRISAVQITLREWTGEFTPPPQKPGIADGKTILGESTIQSFTNTVGAVVGYVQQATAYVSQASEIYDNLSNLKNNPIALVNSLSELYVSTNSAITPLIQLQGISNSIHHSETIINIAQSASNQLLSLIDNFTASPPKTSIIIEQMEVVGERLRISKNMLSEIEPLINPLVVQIATRR